MSPLQEMKMHIYANVNTNPEMKGIMHQEGLTSNYTQMLTSADNYVILNNTPSGQFNISHTVVIGNHHNNNNIDYSYGELEHIGDIKKQKIDTAFTHNYKEMLANPDKKMLILGIQEENINTGNTRALKTEMEDPIIKIDEQDDQEAKADYEKRLEQKTQEIREYLDTVHDELTKHAGKNINDEQIDIIKSLDNYIKKGESDTEPIKKFQDSIEQILQIFKQSQSQRLKANSVVKQAIQSRNIIEDKIELVQQAKKNQQDIRVRKIINPDVKKQDQTDSKQSNEDKK